MFGFKRGERSELGRLSLLWGQNKEQLAFLMIALLFGTVLYLTILQ